MKMRVFSPVIAILLGTSPLNDLSLTAQELTPVFKEKTISLNPISIPDISLEQANLALERARQKAVELGVKMDIAVVDTSGNLKAFIRMDGACLGCIDIAIRKARTARYFDRPTGELGKLSQPGSPLYGIEHSNGGLITFPGGVPIKDAQGRIFGAIGVSGDTVENDHIVATAGAEAVGGTR